MPIRMARPLPRCAVGQEPQVRMLLLRCWLLRHRLTRWVAGLSTGNRLTSRVVRWSGWQFIAGSTRRWSRQFVAGSGRLSGQFVARTTRRSGLNRLGRSKPTLC